MTAYPFHLEGAAWVRGQVVGAFPATSTTHFWLPGDRSMTFRDFSDGQRGLCLTGFKHLEAQAFVEAMNTAVERGDFQTFMREWLKGVEEDDRTN